MAPCPLPQHPAPNRLPRLVRGPLRLTDLPDLGSAEGQPQPSVCEERGARVGLGRHPRAAGEQGAGCGAEQIEARQRSLPPGSALPPPEHTARMLQTCPTHPVEPSLLAPSRETTNHTPCMVPSFSSAFSFLNQGILLVRYSAHRGNADSTGSPPKVGRKPHN